MTMDANIYIKIFSTRLKQLRKRKKVSARDMSTHLGQSHNFINNIELGKNFPTMLNFFYICEFLQISPKEYFDYGNQNSTEMVEIVRNLNRLSKEEFEHVAALVSDLTSHKS